MKIKYTWNLKNVAKVAATITVSSVVIAVAMDIAQPPPLIRIIMCLAWGVATGYFTNKRWEIGTYTIDDTDE